MEHHPRLDKSNLLLPEQRIILGSFPVWSLTPAEDDFIREEKRVERIRKGDFDFFYGSSRNKFWYWYQNFVDEKITVNDVDVKATHY